MAASPANSHGNGYPLGLAGAVLATRFVGGTATVAPTTGPFEIGDFVIGRNGTLFVCTVAGTPGTWVQVGAGGSGTVTSVTATDGSVVVTGTATDPTIATAALNTIAGLKAMSGALAMNAQKITGLANGAAAQDAATYAQLARYLDYVPITSTATFTATSSATANTLITGSSVTYDGATVVELICGSPTLGDNATGASTKLDFYEDSASIATVGQVGLATGFGLAYATFRLTPSAGAHTYSVRGWVSGGTGKLYAGAGGAGVIAPAFIAVRKVVS